MQYVGGKFRQSKVIAEQIIKHKTNETTYVEPFCGMCSVAKRVYTHFDNIILADTNEHVVNLLKMLQNNEFTPVEWVSQEEMEKQYTYYKTHKPKGDPLTAFYGYGMSFGGKYFGGLARGRNNYGKGGSYEYLIPANKSLLKLQEVFQNIENLTIVHTSYENLQIPDDTIVYCDPPYQNRMQAYKGNTFDSTLFWEWVQNSKNTTYITEFDVPKNLRVLHSWGDTVVNHKHGKKGATNEVLVTNK